MMGYDTHRKQKEEQVVELLEELVGKLNDVLGTYVLITGSKTWL